MKLSGMIKHFLFISFLFLIVANQTVYSQAEDAGIEIEILSYEEMMKLLVVTASKEEQKVSDAPAIIDVITENQIKELNPENLYELLGYLPGIEIMETYFGRTVTNFRGIKSIHYNDKVLLMINGNPAFEPVNSSFFLETLPVSSIARIEVIRGPGSSLYGTNAYAGVINIITKNGQGKSEFEATLAYGSYSSLEVEAAGRLKFNDNSGVFVAGSFTNTNGYPFKVNADERSTGEEFDYFTKPFNLYTNLYYSNFSLDFGIMKLNKSLYGITPNLNYKGESDFSNFYANAKYSHDFSDNVTGDVFVRYSKFENESTDIGQFPFPEFAGHAASNVHLTFLGNIFSTELQINSKLSDVLSNVSGIQYESFSSDPYLFNWSDDGSVHPLSAYQEEYSSSRISGYSQFNFKASEKLKFVAGVRLIKDEDIEDMFFAPRAGVILKLSEKYFVKALYGKAFRSPSFFEKYVATSNVLFGSPTLETENIQTFDLGLEAEISDEFNLRLNGFYNNTTDGIARTPTDNPDLHGSRAAIYKNFAESEIYGLELFFRGLIGNKGYYGFNVSWKDGKDIIEDEKVDMKGLASITMNGWVNYNFDQFRVTPSFKFVGEREGTSARTVNDVAVGDYALDSYLLFNVSVAYKYDNFEFSVTGNNLFDTDFSYPEYIRGLSEEVPGGPGRTISFQCRVNFKSDEY